MDEKHAVQAAQAAGEALTKGKGVKYPSRDVKRSLRDNLREAQTRCYNLMKLVLALKQHNAFLQKVFDSIPDEVLAAHEETSRAREAERNFRDTLRDQYGIKLEE